MRVVGENGERMNTTFRKFLHTAKLELFDKNFARSSGQLGQARLRPIRPEPRTCTPRQAQKCTGLARIMQAGATSRGNMLRLPRHAHDRPSSTLVTLSQRRACCVAAASPTVYGGTLASDKTRACGWAAADARPRLPGPETAEKGLKRLSHPYKNGIKRGFTM